MAEEEDSAVDGGIAPAAAAAAAAAAAEEEELLDVRLGPRDAASDAEDEFESAAGESGGIEDVHTPSDGGPASGSPAGSAGEGECSSEAAAGAVAQEGEEVCGDDDGAAGDVSPPPRRLQPFDVPTSGRFWLHDDRSEQPQQEAKPR